MSISSSTPWTIRPASIVDVTRIVRLAEQGEDGSQQHGFMERPYARESGELAENVDLSKAGSTARLFLSHGALEYGKVFVAEDDEGLAGAVIWLPLDLASPETVMTEFARIVEREVGLPTLAAHPAKHVDHIAPAARQLVDAIVEVKAEWILVAFISRPEFAANPALLQALTEPSLLETSSPVMALSLRTDLTQALTHVGFAITSQILLSQAFPELELILTVHGRQS